MNLNYIDLLNKKSGKAMEHTHNLWEFILTISGEGFIYVDGNEYPFKKGTVVCVPPGALHYNTSENEYSHIAIRFNGFVNQKNTKLTIFQDDDDGSFENLAKLTLKMFYRKDKVSEFVLGHLCDALCALFTSSIEENKNPEVEIVRDIIISNFSNPSFNVLDAFESMYYSKGYFRKLFCAEMGMTPLEYLTKLRLEYAASLLVSGEPYSTKTAYVAERSGFLDHRYFSRLFKKKYSITPQEYRKKMLSEKPVSDNEEIFEKN